MNLRTVKYFIREGAVNTYKNKLMSFASIGIVTASLIIFGIFFMISLNITTNLRVFKEQPEVIVFCLPELDQNQVKVVKNEIESDQDISTVEQVTKKEYFKKVQEMLGENHELLEDLDADFLPVKFNLKLKDIEKFEAAVNRLKNIKGVWDVQYPKKVVNFISSITYWMRLISIFLIIVLVIISMFIVENTIKLTVFARRKEINIMKHIGATNWFIRWPFIVEGVIIGFTGAVLALVIVSYTYSTIEKRVNYDILCVGINIVHMVDIQDIVLQLVLLYSMLGVLIGSLGSFFSTRKYLVD